MSIRIARRRFGAVACNDNQPIHRSIALPRRPILFCHWHKAASGALECGWLTEATSAAKVEEPDIGRLRPSRRTYIAVASALHLLP
jgi:hypothetical protein